MLTFTFRWACAIGRERTLIRVSRRWSASDREVMAERLHGQLPVEICVTTNLGTGSSRRVQEHPLKMYFDTRVMLTINSDDPGIFRTSIGREYQLAQDAFGFTDEQLREIARNSFEAAFLPAEEKLALLNLWD